MGKDERQEFHFESLQDGQSIGQYLGALADGFRSGRLEFRTGERTIELEPRGLLKFELEADQKGDRVKMVLKFAWKRTDAGRPAEPRLVIAPGEADERHETNDRPGVHHAGGNHSGGRD